MTRPTQKKSQPLPEGAPGCIALLDRLVKFIGSHEKAPNSKEALAHRIITEREPFILTVCYTILADLCGPNPYRQRRFHRALKRGARTYHALLNRLDPTGAAPPPPGLNVEAAEAFLVHLPAAADLLALSHLAHAFLSILEDLVCENNEEALANFANELYDEFIRTRMFGSVRVDLLFPWEPPHWVSSSRDEGMDEEKHQKHQPYVRGDQR